VTSVAREYDPPDHIDEDDEAETSEETETEKG
jgi:hypothetical protein